MNELALFAGVGGGILGSRLLGWRTVCYVERDPYCVEVLKARIRDGYIDDAPIWSDVTTFDGRPWRGVVDIVSAGFPCQPWSLAGKMAGEMDSRNLWPDTIRIAGECGAEWLQLENVPGLLSNAYIRRVFADLAQNGFDARWSCISAAEIGANHKRDRLWIVAHANGRRRAGENDEIRPGENVAERRRQDVANPESTRLERAIPARANATAGRIVQCIECNWWAAEPGLGRVANGVAYRMDRLKAIGNGQVPGVVRRAWRELSG